MKENKINEWERYLNAEASVEEKAKIELKLETDPTYKEHLLAFMLMRDSLAVLGHEAAIEAEVNQLGEHYRKKETQYDRGPQDPTLFGALFRKSTKRELWTVLGGVACVILVGCWLLIPDKPTYAKIEMDDKKGLGVYGDDDSLAVAFYSSNKGFWRWEAEYEWPNDTLKLYKLDPKTPWQVSPTYDPNTYLLHGGGQSYRIIKGKNYATALKPDK